VDLQSLVAAEPRARHRHVDPGVRRGAQVPECRGIAVTQESIGAAGKHGRHPVAISAERCVAERVDAAVNPVQPPD